MRRTGSVRRRCSRVCTILPKNWYQLRALRVFRDKTRLSSSPGLWPEIEKVLADCEYFLFLASSRAAASGWVVKELESWLANCSVETLLIVLTDRS